MNIPEQAQFEQREEGQFEWVVDKVSMNEQLMDGSLTVDYYNDDTVKGFTQNIVIYNKVQDVQLKSEQQAFEEIVKGKFMYYTENNEVQQIQIEQVKIGYQLDSKGFFQPVYEFSSVIDGKEALIIIAGIE